MSPRAKVRGDDDRDHRVTVLGDNGDSTISVSVDGGEAQVMSKEQLQQMRDQKSMAQTREKLGKPVAGSSEQEAEETAVQAGGETEGQTGDAAAAMPQPTGQSQQAVEAGQTNLGKAESGQTENRNEQGVVGPMPMVGEGDDAEPDFLATTPKRGHDYLYGEAGIKPEAADRLVENQMAAADKALEKVKGEEPEMVMSVAKYKREMAEWQQKVDAAQKASDYWHGVREEHARAVEEQAVVEQQAPADETHHDGEVTSDTATGNDGVTTTTFNQYRKTKSGRVGRVTLGGIEAKAEDFILAPDNSFDEMLGSTDKPIVVKRIKSKDGQHFADIRVDGVDYDGVPMKPQSAERLIKAAEQSETKLSSEGNGEPKPIGGNRFGGIYNQFKGKVKEAFDFLLRKKDGYLKAVFHRDDIGDIDLAWGSAPTDYTGKGLAHIIRKHIYLMKDFRDIDEAMRIIENVINSGKAEQDKNDSQLVNIEKGNYRVVVAKNEEGNWVLSAFDFVTSKKEKLKRGKTLPPSKTPGQPNEEAGAVTSNLSESKDSTNSADRQENGGENAGEPTLLQQYEQEQGTVDEQGGLVKNEKAESLLSENWRGALHGLGRRIGRRIEIVSNEQLRRMYGTNGIRGCNDNARNTIYLSEDYIGDDEYMRSFITGHELTHALKRMTEEYPDLWKEYVKAVKEAMGDDFAKEFARIRALYDRAYARMRAAGKNYTPLTDAQIEEEIACDWAGNHMLTDIDSIQRVVEHAEKAGVNPMEIARKVLDWIKERIAWLTGAKARGENVDEELTYMEKARQLWQGMYDVATAKQNERAAREQALRAAAEQQPTENGEEVKFSVPGEEENQDGKDEQVSSPIQEEIKRAEKETETYLTDAQKKAGNYKKGHVKIDGFDISIEQPKGSVRSGVDESGKAWSTRMNNTYGYIRGTEGADGDHIDVFLSDHLDNWNGIVYVVDQVKEDGTFDEHKVMYGFNSADEARTAYLSNYEKGWKGLGALTSLGKDGFKEWVHVKHQKTKPFAEYKRQKGEDVKNVYSNLSSSLSDELNEFAIPFVISSNGTTDFGEVDKESGLQALPIRLNLGENTVDENGKNHGYGLLHIEAGHGQQIRNAGYSSVEDFVEKVARNYKNIRLGSSVANNQTYLLELVDDHSNSLFVQLSRDGSYWNVNSAGIFKEKYSRRRPIVYTRPALEPGTDTDSSEVNHGHTMGATVTSRNSSKTSIGKDNTNNPNPQENSEKNTDNSYQPDFSIAPEEGAAIDAREIAKVEDEEGGSVQFSIREDDPPKKVLPCYKLVRLGKDGKAYPLFIDAATPMEIGTWYDADSPDLSMLQGLPSGVHLVNQKTKEVISYDDFFRDHPELFKKKKPKFPTVDAVNWASDNGMRFMYIEDTERGQRRFGGENRKYWNLGINGSGAVSTFSLRPGWHAASLPSMRQIGKGDKRDLRDDTFVWVLGEISADVDYNEEARQNPDNDLPDRVPVNGYYMKATNADAAKSQADRIGWYVAGAFRPVRFISDAEARKVIDDWNREHPDAPVEYDYERESGRVFNADTMQLEEPGLGESGGEQVSFSLPGEEDEEQVKFLLGDPRETFREQQEKAVEEKGVVMAGLNNAVVNVTKDIPKHPYTGNIKEATRQAIEAATRKYNPNGNPEILHYNNYGRKFDYTISGNAVSILLSAKHQGMSSDKGGHLA